MGTQISFSLHPSSDKHSTAHDTHLMQIQTRMKYEMLMSNQSHSPLTHCRIFSWM